MLSKMYKDPKVYSSYSQNHLGKTLYSTVISYKPKKIIEFGVLNGYSTIAMAEALADLGEGRLIGYDLFEEYPYKHATIGQARENIKKYKVEKFVKLQKKNFHEWIKNPEDFDLLHLDISNDGDIILLAYQKLKKYLEGGAVIIFEGGTRERDNVHWMHEYNKSPIFSLKKTIGYKILDARFPGIGQLGGNYATLVK